MRTSIILLGLALACCQRATHSEVVGAYQLTSPYFNNAAGKALNQRLVLTPVQAIVSMGNYETAGEYEVKGGFVYLVSDEARFGYRIIGHDTLRYEGPLSPMPIDYVRVKQ